MRRLFGCGLADSMRAYRPEELRWESLWDIQVWAQTTDEEESETAKQTEAFK